MSYPKNPLNHIPLRFFNKIKKCAKSRNIPFNVSIEYLQTLFDSQNYKCALSGIDIYIETSRIKTASLDRIDSSKGYIEGNVQWVHKDINNMKMGLDENSFIFYCKKISRNLKNGN